MQPSEFFLGLDLAQSNDYTALVGLERRDDPALNPPPRSYDCVLIERWRERSYADVPRLVDRAERALRTLAAERIYRQSGHFPELSAAATTTLCVDATGVGAGVVDMLEAAGCAPARVDHRWRSRQSPRARGLLRPEGRSRGRRPNPLGEPQTPDRIRSPARGDVDQRVTKLPLRLHSKWTHEVRCGD